MTKIICIRIDKIKQVERILGRELAANQVPIVKIRVTDAEHSKIKRILK